MLKLHNAWNNLCTPTAVPQAKQNAEAIFNRKLQFLGFQILGSVSDE